MKYIYLILLNYICICVSYKPVVLIHGVLTGNVSMGIIAARIKEKHPGTVIYNTERFAGWSSVEPMWRQVLEIGADVINISNSNPNGIHLLGYSQGGLLARAILETFPEHNVHNFISLSSPQGGQFGTAFLHLFFPDLVCKTAYELFYSRVGQRTSVGNYWNDPHKQKLYFKYSVFLPFINNLIASNRSESFKKGIVKLKKMVLIGGPDDGVITPWQSSHFGYYGKNETVIDYKDQLIYKHDTFGLKTLDKSRRLVVHEVPGVTHFDWHINVDIVDKYILPYLD
ncbi:lysosomal thioesterase PPT2 homolog [Chrysoperla carnea]|uniref:lysosomal thioesterase PPT2 homolog n=1 Tax=Chrysoperla carnea TaxID=189513 RepID=UPI001D0811DB|nr:lysosomal thioesterase PPT2 homolog [Chrysoperla carnea]